MFTSTYSWADGGDKSRLAEIMKLEVQLKSEGKSLSKEQKEEYDSLVKIIGVVDAAVLKADLKKEQEKQKETKMSPQIQEKYEQKYESLKGRIKTKKAPEKDLVEADTVEVKPAPKFKPESQAQKVDQDTDPRDLKKDRYDELMERISKATEKEKAKGSKLYSPTNIQQKNSNGLFTERDSETIVEKAVAVNDAITVQMCYDAGVSIHLHDSIDTTIQRPIIDDSNWFTLVAFQNGKGVYVHLTKQVPRGMFKETSLRLFRKNDDRAYLINIIGVPCPDGMIRYPKVIYLKNKENTLANGRDVKGREILPFEDMVIGESHGYVRTNSQNVVVYDMVTSSGSNSVILGVEIDGRFSDGEFNFTALDNLQINKLDLDSKFLPIQSDKSSVKKGKKVSRYRIVIPGVDKNYIMKRRYVYLMFLNHKTKEYEYVQVDLSVYFKSLKERGMEL